MTIEKYGRKYGDATLLGDQGDNFLKRPVEEQALALAWSEACPVGPDLVKPISEGGRGPQEMVKRYGEIIFWFKYLKERLIEKGKNEIANQLSLPKSRGIGEELGKHSPNWLPDEAETTIFRSATGYILPRLVTEFVGVGGNDKSSSLQTALETYEGVIPRARDSVDLVVNFAEKLAADLQKKGKNEGVATILKRVLSTGKLNEDNLYTEYDQILDRVQKTVTLKNCYRSFSTEELDSLKIYHR